MRDLFDKINAYTRDDLYHEVLLPWITHHRYHLVIAQMAEFIGDGQLIAPLPVDMSWRLYALSRVLDCLTLGFQPAAANDDFPYRPVLSRQQYMAFAEAMGLTLREPTCFHPFYCEILAAECGEKPFAIVDSRYPALMLGSLLIHRGGVTVTLPPSQYNLDLVNRAELYWAYCRRHRTAHDLSHGWGSNSQWRTGFRLDFACATGFLYNAEGKIDLTPTGQSVPSNMPLDDMSLAEARELTVYRHFIHCTKPDGDLFPYDFRYFVAASDSLSPV
jgi:hypothetical protein